MSDFECLLCGVDVHDTDRSVNVEIWNSGEDEDGKALYVLEDWWYCHDCWMKDNRDELLTQKLLSEG